MKEIFIRFHIDMREAHNSPILIPPSTSWKLVKVDKWWIWLILYWTWNLINGRYSKELMKVLYLDINNVMLPFYFDKIFYDTSQSFIHYYLWSAVFISMTCFVGHLIRMSLIECHNEWESVIDWSITKYTGTIPAWDKFLNPLFSKF